MNQLNRMIGGHIPKSMHQRTNATVIDSKTLANIETTNALSTLGANLDRILDLSARNNSAPWADNSQTAIDDISRCVNLDFHPGSHSDIDSKINILYYHGSRARAIDNTEYQSNDHQVSQQNVNQPFYQTNAQYPGAYHFNDDYYSEEDEMPSSSVTHESEDRRVFGHSITTLITAYGTPVYCTWTSRGLQQDTDEADESVYQEFTRSYLPCTPPPKYRSHSSPPFPAPEREYVRHVTGPFCVTADGSPIRRADDNLWLLDAADEDHCRMGHAWKEQTEPPKWVLGHAKKGGKAGGNTGVIGDGGFWKN